MKKLLLSCVVAGSLITSTAVKADSVHLNQSGLRADSHAPIGVMGEHMHGKGDWMVSYRFMRMNMEGNRDGTNDLSNEDVIATTNRFGAPANLRVVPEQMTTDMHIIGGMYAPTDNLTLMLMGMYIDREMDHSTYNMGGAQIGEFTTNVRGWGDTKASGLVRLYKDDTHNVYLNAGVSLPTGSISKRDTILAPNGATPDLRLPYAMQLGSGTYDLLPGITYTGTKNQYGWGAQYMATMPLGRNDEGYSRGDKHQISAWGSYAIAPAVSVSGRLTAEKESKIDNIDSEIAAPVQTADPDNYGGKRVSASLGLNTVVPTGALKGHRFSTEITAPLYQNLNGPQMKRDYALTVGWSKAF